MNGKPRSSPRRGYPFVAQLQPTTFQPTAFAAEDITTCFSLTEDGGCEKAPEFRLIILDGEGVMEHGELPDSDISVGLFCRDCAVVAAAEMLSVIGGSTASSIPVLGVLLLPLHMPAEVALKLGSEVTPEVAIEPQSECST